VRHQLRKQLGDFLRKRRGSMTYSEFARKIGISSSTLQRIEVGEQNVTLDTLETLFKRLNCRISDVFSDS
jgi:DNA-binding Xre family transcriptional regulator